MKVCPKCGWYEHGPYRSGECDPVRGKFVDEVLAMTSGEGTKLGYGVHNFAIKYKDVTLVFNAHRDRTCTLERVFGLHDLKAFEVDALMDAVLRIRA